MRIEVGKCDAEDLARWRDIDVKVRSVETNPRAYSKEETEAIYRQRQRALIDLGERYNLDDREADWTVDTVSGAIFYEGGS